MCGRLACLSSALSEALFEELTTEVTHEKFEASGVGLHAQAPPRAQVRIWRLTCAAQLGSCASLNYIVLTPPATPHYSPLSSVGQGSRPRTVTMQTGYA